MGVATGIAAMLARKKITPSVTKAIKASPKGMFPAAAAKAGISMKSKLGQAITKSPTGKLPPMLTPPQRHQLQPIENKGKAPFDMDKFKKAAGRSK